MSITTGKVAFENLTEYEVYDGKSTGKYSLTLLLDDDEGKALKEKGVKTKEYEGSPQRKFSSKFPVAVYNVDDSPFEGRVTRGSTVRIQWTEGKPHPVYGTSTYLNKVRVLELSEDLNTEEGF